MKEDKEENRKRKYVHIGVNTNVEGYYIPFSFTSLYNDIVSTIPEDFYNTYICGITTYLHNIYINVLSMFGINVGISPTYDESSITTNIEMKRLPFTQFDQFYETDIDDSLHRKDLERMSTKTSTYQYLQERTLDISSVHINSMKEEINHEQSIKFCSVKNKHDVLKNENQRLIEENIHL